MTGEIKDLLAYLRLLVNPADTVGSVAGDQRAETRYRQDHNSAPFRCRQSTGDPPLGRGGDPEAVRSLGGRSARVFFNFVI